MKKSTSFNFVLSSVLFFALIFTGNAQLQNANWYFGKGAGLNFNDGTQPGTILTNSVMSTVGGCATVSDANGELLFYTDSKNIWTKTHEPMKGSGLLFGSPDVSQNVVIVPSPNDVNKYYIFTNEGFMPDSHGLSYTVVDMSLQNGLGSVDELILNNPLLSHSSEKLTTVFNPTDNSYWIIAFAPSGDPTHSDTFYTYKLDENGVNLYCQSTHSFLSTNFNQPGGQMKISPDGTALGLVHNTLDVEDGRVYGSESVFSFDFDIITGVVSTQKIYSIENVLYCYGLEFSPNSDEIFVSTTHQITDNEPYYSIYQICYRGMDSQYCPIQFVASCESPVYSLQLGIDNVIHVASYYTGYLYCFTNPDGHSQNSSFESRLCYLDGRFCAKGLPQLVPQFVPHLETPQVLTTPLIISSKIYTVVNNPFDEELKLKFHVKGKFKINVIQLSGRNAKFKNVEVTELDQVVKLDTDNLKSGMYVLNVKDKDHKNHNETVLKVNGHGHGNGHGNDDDDDNGHN